MIFADVEVGEYNVIEIYINELVRGEFHHTLRCLCDELKRLSEDLCFIKERFFPSSDTTSGRVKADGEESHLDMMQLNENEI